jgi:hypothetical protein
MCPTYRQSGTAHMRNCVNDFWSPRYQPEHAVCQCTESLTPGRVGHFRDLHHLDNLPVSVRWKNFPVFCSNLLAYGTRERQRRAVRTGLKDSLRDLRYPGSKPHMENLCVGSGGRSIEPTPRSCSITGVKTARVPNRDKSRAARGE